MIGFSKLFAAAVAAAIAGAASAGTIGFRFTLITSNAQLVAFGVEPGTAVSSGDGASFDKPYFLLESIGTRPEDMLGMQFRLNSPPYRADFVDQDNAYGNLTFTQISPPAPDNQGNPSNPNVAFTFGGFDVGEKFSARVDVDEPGDALNQSYGRFKAAFDNVLVTVAFQGGRQLMARFDSFPTAATQNNPGFYSVSAVQVVPLPSAAWAGLALMGTVGCMQIRRSMMLKA